MSTQSFHQDDYFKIDPELHLVGDMQPYSHFPGVQMWWKAIANIARPLLSGAPEELFAQLHPEHLAQLQPENLTPTTDPEAVLAIMDGYGVDVACLLPESMMDTTGFSSRWVSNGEMAQAVSPLP